MRKQSKPPQPKYILYLVPSTDNPLQATLNKFKDATPKEICEQNTAFRYPFHITLTSFYHGDSHNEALVHLMKGFKPSMSMVSHTKCHVSNTIAKMDFAMSAELKSFLLEVQNLGLSPKDGLHLSLVYGCNGLVEKARSVMHSTLGALTVGNQWDMVLYRTDDTLSQWHPLYQEHNVSGKD